MQIRPHHFRIPLCFAAPALAAALVFALFPQLDIAIAGWFFDPVTKQFPFSGHPAANAFNFLFNGIAGLFVAGCMVTLGAFAIFRRNLLKEVWRVPAYLIILFAIGPFLMVTHGFKEYWDRARPVQITEFGGEKQFTPYYLPADQCKSDCSFMSGHTARGFYFMGIFFLASAAGLAGWKRKALLAGVITYGTLAGLSRMMEGKHFATDVLAAAILITYVAWVLFRIMEPLKGTVLDKSQN